MSLSIVKAIIRNHAKDTKKNRRSMIMFVLIPILCYVMKLIQTPESPEENNMLVFMYMTMHTTLIPIMSSSTVLAQDKEQNTLRSLYLNGVRPVEYLTSIGLFTALMTTLFGCLFIVFVFDPAYVVPMLIALFVASCISSIIGLAIGCLANTVTAASSMSIVIALPLALIPSFGILNSSLEKAGQVLYNTQCRNLVENGFEVRQLVTILINLCIALLFFFAASRKSKNED